MSAARISFQFLSVLLVRSVLGALRYHRQTAVVEIISKSDGDLNRRVFVLSVLAFLAQTVCVEFGTRAVHGHGVYIFHVLFCTANLKGNSRGCVAFLHESPCFRNFYSACIARCWAIVSRWRNFDTQTKSSVCCAPNPEVFVYLAATLLELDRSFEGRASGVTVSLVSLLSFFIFSRLERLASRPESRAPLAAAGHSDHSVGVTLFRP